MEGGVGREVWGVGGGEWGPLLIYIYTCVHIYIHMYSYNSYLQENDVGTGMERSRR